MDYMMALEWIKALGPTAAYILMGLGTFVVLGTGYVKMTPNLDDDAWLAKMESKAIIGPILKALRSFSLFLRKDDAQAALKK